MSKKRICLLAVGLTLLLAAGFFLALPRTLFDEPFSATVWSRDGRLLSAKVAPDGQWRFFPTDSVPGKFRTAITTYEDKRFDRHFGVDPLALARAVGQNLAAGRIESGASTLTMQTIRLSRGGKPRTFGEKFVEAVLALRLEMRCSKEEILALYAAHAPFGGNVVGLESASWYYFGRSARDLSWAESALLAVLPNAPSLIHMKRNRERLREKRDRLLDRIRSGGHIDSLTCALAEKYDALVMVDECHSAGVLGKTGRGITELYDRRGQVDILTGTLGKAFGGAVGGFTTGRREIIDMLRQRSRPYLFSNSLPPAVVGAGIEMFRMLAESNELHDLLVANVEHFREGMMAAGFDIKPTQSAICAVMLYDAKLSQDFAARLQDEGVFVTGFYYPVVPKGQARIRVQVSAGHTTDQLDRCIAAFTKVGKELNVIK